MWNWCPSLEFLIAQTQSSAEWHLVVSWACSLSTCWCDLFALWSFPSLFCRPGMWPFSKASYLAVPAPEPPHQKRHRDCLFVSARRRWKTQIPHTNSFSSRYQLGRSFLPVNVCVLWVKKDIVGAEESSSRKSQMPAQASLACRLNSLICSGSHFPTREVLPHLAAACLQSCMQGCVPDLSACFLTMWWTRSYVQARTVLFSIKWQFCQNVFK